MLFNLMDYACAQSLEVPVEEFIKKIESCDFKLATEIIELLWDEDPEAIAKAKELFNTIVLPNEEQS